MDKTVLNAQLITTSVPSKMSNWSNAQWNVILAY